jgi:hypothetical protein
MERLAWSHRQSSRSPTTMSNPRQWPRLNKPSPYATRGASVSGTVVPSDLSQFSLNMVVTRFVRSSLRDIPPSLHRAASGDCGTQFGARCFDPSVGIAGTFREVMQQRHSKKVRGNLHVGVALHEGEHSAPSECAKE